MTVTIIPGDALAVLRTMESDSVDCCVTSVPYWGLRDYGVAGQIGMEPTLGEHLDVMVGIFEEVRRVLKPTGTLWLNYGDCYATAPNGRSAADTKAAGTDDRTFRDKPFGTVGPIYAPNHSSGGPRGERLRVNPPSDGRVIAGGTLKPKDLCMIPNRLAIALQDAGWWVRSEIIWGKPNAMPDSSGRYRPSSAHEKIFLLTKSGDADVWVARDSGDISFSPDLTERCPLVTRPDKDGPRWIRLGSHYDASSVMLPVSGTANARVAKDFKRGERVGIGPKTVPVGTFKTRQNESMHEALVDMRDKRLLRNFEQSDSLSDLAPPSIIAWEIAIAGFSGAHFATFPPALVVPCILAGCPKGGTVLDPFGGAGTVGLVAEQLGREAVLIELNDDYSRIARDRLRQALCRVECALPDRHEPGGLFTKGEAA